ncbi:hypothetical protein Landi51_01117 [Colletotrichum acutatum]
MNSLLRLSSGLTFSPDPVANRIPISLGHTAGCTLADVCSTAADTLRNCTPLFDSLFGSISSSPHVYFTHVQLCSTGNAILQLPFDHLGSPLVQHTCSRWLVVVFEHDDIKQRHGFLNFLATCGTGLYLLKPVAAALFADWAPTTPCYIQSRRPLISESPFLSWLPFKTILARPPIPQLLRKWITNIEHHIVQLGARRRIHRNSTVGSGSGSAETSKGAGANKRRKTDPRPNGNSPPSNNGHSNNDSGGEHPSIDAKPDKKRILACHFYAHDPNAHGDCQGYHFVQAKDVKRHLTEPDRGDHYPLIHCVICHAVFPSHAELTVHARAQTCDSPPPGSNIHDSRLNQDQAHEIASMTKLRAESQSEFWFRIWEVAFPDEPRPLSPYRDDVQRLAYRQQVEPRMAETTWRIGRQHGVEDHVIEQLVRGITDSFNAVQTTSHSPVEHFDPSPNAPGIHEQPASSSSQQPRPASPSLLAQSQALVVSTASITNPILSHTQASMTPNPVNVGELHPHPTSSTLHNTFRPNSQRPYSQALTANNSALPAQNRVIAPSILNSPAYPYPSVPYMNEQSPFSMNTAFTANYLLQHPYGSSHGLSNEYFSGQGPGNNSAVSDDTWVLAGLGDDLASFTNMPGNDAVQTTSNLLPPELRHCECETGSTCPRHSG